MTISTRGLVSSPATTRIAGDKFQVTWIDFYDDELVELRMVGNYFRPGTGGESDHQDAFWCRMKSAQRKRAEDAVDVVDEVDRDASIVNPASVNDDPHG